MSFAVIMRVGNPTLTVTVRAGGRLPKSSKMVITAEMSKIAQIWLKRLALKFKDESFGAIKCSNFFSAEISAEMNRKTPPGTVGFSRLVP